MSEEESGSQKIQTKDIIYLDYDLWIKDDEVLFETTHRELAEEQGILDENASYKPIPIIVDEGRAVKGLYISLLASEIGKEVEVEVPPEDGLGERDPKLVEWHMLNDLRRQKVEPEMGKEITVKDKSGKDRIGVVIMMSPRRVRVDYNNRLAGKTLKYKYNITKKAHDIQEKIMMILEMNFSKPEGFELEVDNDDIDIKLPEECKYDPTWHLVKFRVVNDLREYTPLKKIRFVEEYVKKEEKEEEKVEPKEEVKEEKPEEKEEKSSEAVEETKEEETAEESTVDEAKEEAPPEEKKERELPPPPPED
jgi:FKBP-type peptidyl-prolyl cis-trans isomerase 2